MKKNIFIITVVLPIIFMACSNLTDAVYSLSDAFAALADTDKAAIDQSTAFLNSIDTEIVQNADTLSADATKTINVDGQEMQCKVTSITPGTSSTTSPLFFAAATSTVTKTIALEFSTKDDTSAAWKFTITIYDDKSWSIDGTITFTTKDTEGKKTPKKVQFTKTSVDKDGNLISGDIAVDEEKVQIDSVNTLKKLNMLAGDIATEINLNQSKFDYTTLYKVKINDDEEKTLNSYSELLTHVITEFRTLALSGVTEGTVNINSSATLKTISTIKDFTFDMTTDSTSTITFGNGKVSTKTVITLNFNGEKDGISASGSNIIGTLYYDLSDASEIANSLTSIAIRWTGTITVNGKEIPLKNMRVAAFDYVEYL